MSNLRSYLLSHQPNGGSKTFNLKGIEEKLGIPSKTIEHFIRGRRTLSGHDDKVVQFFKTLGYDENQQYDPIV